MGKIKKWCEKYLEMVRGNRLILLSVLPNNRRKLSDYLASVACSHYISSERLSDVMSRLGRPAVARLINEILPKSTRLRSGELGEIVATEYIELETSYNAPIKRLRSKEHPEMSMRGNDVLAIRVSEDSNLSILKCEVKSGERITSSVVVQARSQLDTDAGLPSPHALTFFATKLFEMGEFELVDRINDAQLKYGLSQEQVEHLLFTFSQNDPTVHLRSDLDTYSGAIRQNNTGIRVSDHQQFIEETYTVALHGNDN